MPTAKALLCSIPIAQAPTAYRLRKGTLMGTTSRPASGAPRSAAVPRPVGAALAVEDVALTALRSHPRNYKTHPDDQLAHLQESIREHGLYRNIVVARDNTILAGHGVVAAARRMGYETVPVVRLDLAPEEPRALKVLAGDNEVMHLGERDDRALSELLKEIKDTDLDGLLGTGYDEMMLATLALVTRPESEIKDFDEAAHWAGMPGYAPEAEPPSILVKFGSESDRDDFVRRLGLRLGENARQTWWPPRGQDDVAAVRIAG
jgi:hypothetical protein